MSGNKNHDTPDNPAIPQLVNSSGDKSPTNSTDSSRENKSSEGLHQAVTSHKPKKWKEYFLEFLMVFLAVTLGFFAENYREHLVNKNIERQNIVSLVRNLEQDSTVLTSLIENNKFNNLMIDSLCRIPGSFSDPSFQHSFFKYATQLNWLNLFTSQNSTFLQMQSSGTMRLISNPLVRERILLYEDLNEQIKKQATYIEIAYRAGGENLSKITDVRASLNNMPLTLKGDTQYIQHYLNDKLSEKSSIDLYVVMLQHQLANARSMINFFRKEYSITDHTATMYDDKEFKELSALPCENEASLRSSESESPTVLRFKNNTRKNLTIQWIDYTGHRNSGANQVRHLESGKTLDQQTYVTHPFVVMDHSGKCYGIYMAEPIPSIAVIVKR